MRIIKFISISFLVGLVVLVNSCDADKLELTNPNELKPETYFENETQVQAAVNAAYGNLQTRGLYNRHIWFGYDNMAHENSGNSQLESDKRQYLNFSFDATHGPIGAFWESCYRGINKANFVISNEDKINAILPSEMADERKAKFLGEARFLRALYYFMIVTRFGDAPLVLEPPYEVTDGLPRSPASEIWTLIEQDLQYAAANCLDRADEEAGRATTGAAWAMLGKVYLFQEKYQEAMNAFGHVTGYSLVDRFLDNFEEETEHNNEQIFQVEFNIAAGNSSNWSSDRSDIGQNEACFRGQEYGCNDWFNVYPSANLFHEFEAGDPRIDYCFYVPGDVPDTEEDDEIRENSFLINGGSDTVTIAPIVLANGDTYNKVGWRKYQNYYKQANEDQKSGINMNIIRYADVLLMMAECQARLGNIGDAATVGSAVELMNRVRARTDVAMPPYPTADYPVGNIDEFMVALEHERKVELCGEQVRWPDLVRWGRAAAFISQLSTTQQLPVQEASELQFNAGTHLLWPIPQQEIDANVNINENNPGY
jgi:hypothetical protein